MQADALAEVTYVKPSLVSQTDGAKRSPSVLVGASAAPKVPDLRKDPGVHSPVSELYRMV